MATLPLLILPTCTVFGARGLLQPVEQRESPNMRQVKVGYNDNSCELGITVVADIAVFMTDDVKIEPSSIVINEDEVVPMMDSIVTEVGLEKLVKLSRAAMHETFMAKKLEEALSIETFINNNMSNKDKPVDNINPAHYRSNASSIECIEVTRHMNFNVGNAVKYLWRNGLKSQDTQVEDLEKAIWYLKDEIERLSKSK